jgi:hypothetical protein
MRILFRLVLAPTFIVLATACSHHGPGGGGLPDAPSALPAFEITSADVSIAAGQEATYAFYFHTTNTTPVAVNKWASSMSPGSHHAIMYIFQSSTGTPPDGIDMHDSCGPQGGGGTNIGVWTYATQMEQQEENLPADDGAGKPVAQLIQPNSAGCFQLHYLNSTDNAIMGHIDLKAFALPTGSAYTQTEAYVTYQYNISVGPGATGVTVSASCPVPTGVKFWTMSTHSHKQSVATDVADASAPVFHATDWEHPGAQQWMTAPFYSFTSPNLTWSCTYNNNAPPPYCDQTASGPCSNADATVVQGTSARINEMCMAVGYFFPATAPKFEIDYNGSCIGM